MGWVALVGPEEEENLSLRYLASSLTAGGFRAEIFPFNNENELGRVLEAILSAEEAPVLVGISLAFQWRAKDCLALAVALRERGYAGHITAGGHFGSFACGEILSDFPEVDSICTYEAEETIVSLAGAVVSDGSLADVEGLAFRDAEGEVLHRPLSKPPDLASLPWPDRRGEPASCLGHAIAPLVGSRGCYANCAFCCIAAWHKQSLSGKRFRTRPVDDLADEMVWLKKQRGVDIFIFHDDNFFVPGQRQNLERIHGLADALEARGIGQIATVIKARPTDVTEEVFRVVQDRLGCIRVFLGIETDAAQGLETLRRRVSQSHNHEAMGILDDLDIYVCYNMLIFDPDTTLEDLETNLAFMETYADSPMNFGRVELYAGTPLLERMRSEGRCVGDYLGWDYRLASREMDRIFHLATDCFVPRNFAAGALANRLQGTRFDVEVCRHFHSDVFRELWLAEAKDLSRWLARDSVSALREITEFVGRQDNAESQDLVEELSRRLRQTEWEVGEAAQDLEYRVQEAVGARCRHSRPVEAIVASQPNGHIKEVCR
ncbi:MAG: B12-binding domain-containing radical SAM protein [Planctomycetota bacterium]|jgi:radical SAM superfamily enzyme YgiQ (UPF0313 family)